MNETKEHKQEPIGEFLPPITEMPPTTQFIAELYGIAALNPWINYISPGRAQMLTASHLAQSLTTIGRNEPYFQQGIESEYGKATFSIKMPARGVVRHIINRYNVTENAESIRENPETIFIYEDTKTRQLGVVIVPKLFSVHTYFGSRYVQTSVMERLAPGDIIEEGTILADSPAKMDTGNYAFVVEAKVAFIGHPATGDDGLVVRRSFLERLSYLRVERRVVEWGENTYPIGIYTDPNAPLDAMLKIFPDIGDKIRKDTILMALRRFDERTAPVDMNIHALRHLDHAHDMRTFVRGGEGIVRDIIVTTNLYNNKDFSRINEQCRKYIDANMEYCRNMVEVYKTFRRHNPKAPITREYHMELVRCLIELQSERGIRYNKMYRKTPLDHFRVEFVIEYTVVPNLGHKITGLSGDKGVICYIADDDEMPVDENGVVADIIMGPEARTNRMNIAGLHNHYFAAVAYECRMRALQAIGMPFKESTSYTYCIVNDQNKRNAKYAHAQMLREVQRIARTDRARFDRAWHHIIMFYRCVSKFTAFFYDSQPDNIEIRIKNMTNVLVDMFYVPMPMKYMEAAMESIELCEKYIKPLKAPLKYKGYSGKMVETSPTIIGSIPVILLEKTADDWSSVGSPKTQHFGFPAQISKTDKYSEAGRRNPAKTLGETETRIVIAYCGARTAVEILDRNNNPAAHVSISENLVTHDTPTNIDTVVDRNVIPYGDHKAVAIFLHVLTCMGVGLVYVRANEINES